MTELLPYAAFVLQCGIGVGMFRWLWRLGMPERYVAVRVPERVDGPITLSTDTQGLIY